LRLSFSSSGDLQAQELDRLGIPEEGYRLVWRHEVRAQRERYGFYVELSELRFGDCATKFCEQVLTPAGTIAFLTSGVRHADTPLLT
jgi:hypothetical protein